jgi:hypothetical protein
MHRGGLRFPSDAAGDALFRLFSDGDPVIETRKVDFPVKFDGPDASERATAFAQRLKLMDMEVGVHEGKPGPATRRRQLYRLGMLKRSSP